MDLLSLPEVVRSRIDQLPEQTRRSVGALRFAPPVEKWELRKNADGTVGLTGYATVYNFEYPVMGGSAGWGWDETMELGAFDRVVREKQDVRMLINHDGLPLGRTKSGTLSLESDTRGLLCDLPSLDPANPFAAAAISCLTRGDVDEMSLGFIIGSSGRQEWNGDYTKRSIFDVEECFDTSIVTYPANPAAVVGLRSFSRSAASPDAGLTARLRSREVEALALRQR